MASLDIPRLRLANQHISQTSLDKPADIVARLGAVQAQDYAGALWGIGLRMTSATEKEVEQAVADRSIVRTWPMRRTLHFVAAADVRWMLELLTPRVLAASAKNAAAVGLDEAMFKRSRKLFVRALEGGNQLRRDAMYRVLESDGIETGNYRGLHILCRLSQEGLLCFGARDGKQPTFALLGEWVPAAKTRPRDESLMELARRYFGGHGPATVQDFVWWSGLTVADARVAIEMAKSDLAREDFDGQTYWLAPSAPSGKEASPTAHLLPPYDEYTVAYTDRSAVLDPKYAKLINTGNGVFSPIIVIDGQVVGMWKRALKKDAVVVTPTPFTKFSKAESRAIAVAAGRYGKFLRATVVDVAD
ncbi:MAG TPA: winged helix DNA-binding domain-containing protein [Blastocatellia bacterium]|nr:winged helix DNA-binding domain-containing protein [Blastocatellia bacterium]